MADVFEEVEEGMRAERWKAFARKALPWIIGLLVIAALALGGWWLWRQQQQRSAAEASEAYASGFEAMQQQNTALADRQFARAAEAGSPAYRTLALMQRGGIALGNNNNAAAVRYFDEAAEAAPDEMLADAARLKGAFAVMDTASYEDIERRLTPLIEQDRPYRLLAREALAMARLAHGRGREARGDFVVISLSEGAPESMQARARAAIQLIDSGATAVVPQMARAAAALPPQPVAPPAGAPAAPVPAGPAAQAPAASPPAASPPAPTAAPAPAPAQ